MLSIIDQNLNSIINHFLTAKNNDSFIISTIVCEDSKPFILVEIPYCEEQKWL